MLMALEACVLDWDLPRGIMPIQGGNMCKRETTQAVVYGTMFMVQTSATPVIQRRERWIRVLDLLVFMFPHFKSKDNHRPLPGSPSVKTTELKYTVKHAVSVAAFGDVSEARGI